MAKPQDTRDAFTPAEEAIITALIDQPTRVVVAELSAAGFQTRTEVSIRKKKQRLRDSGMGGGEYSNADLGQQVDTLQALEASLTERLAATKAALGVTWRTLSANAEGH